MHIQIMNGDITTAPNGFILHGCNLQNVMGSGVAKAIAAKWPQVKELYHKMFQTSYESDTNPSLGNVQYVKVEPCLTVVNGLTQEFYGNDGERYADLAAIDSCVGQICSMMVITQVEPECRRLHMPLIGGERGGLDFYTEVAPIIEHYAALYPSITFIIWEYDNGD